MKVAVVYHHFAHYRGAVLSELANRGRHQYVFMADTSNYAAPHMESWEPPPGCEFRRLPCHRIVGRVMWQTGLLQVALGREFDALILLGDVYWPTTWLAAMMARMRGKRTLYWTIGWMRREGRLKGILWTLFMKAPHGLLLYGHFARGRALATGMFNPENLYVIRNCLDYETQRTARESLPRHVGREERERLFPGSGRPVALCVSRLQARRRLDLLIEAAAIMASRGSPCDILLVGDGPERDNLAQLAQEKKVSLCMPGACYDQMQLARYTMSATVTVAPGLVGLTAMQSLAFGVPVITHDDRYEQAPESEVLEEGRSGYLFESGNLQSLVDAMMRATASPWPSANVREACIHALEAGYTASCMREAIENALDGLPARNPSGIDVQIEQAGRTGRVPGKTDQGQAP